MLFQLTDATSPHHSCQKGFYYDSFSMACSTCSDRVLTAAPVIVLSTIAALGGGVAIYNYVYHYDFFATYFREQEEHLFMRMNEGTIVVSESDNSIAISFLTPIDCASLSPTL